MPDANPRPRGVPISIIFPLCVSDVFCRVMYVTCTDLLKDTSTKALSGNLEATGFVFGSVNYEKDFHRPCLILYLRPF